MIDKIEEYKKMSTEEFENKIAHWRKQFTEDINNNYAGRSYADANISASMIKSLVTDIAVMMQWIEMLAYKVKELEKEKEYEFK